MSTTSHERAARELVEQILTNGAVAVELGRIRDRLVTEFDPAYIAVFGQTDSRAGQWRLEQRAALLYLHSMVCGGQIARIEIEVGATPGPDAARRANAEALADLPGPFVADVDQTQNASDYGDGTLRWSDDVRVEKSTGVAYHDHGGIYPIVIGKMIRASSVPLEIGTTMPSATLVHVLAHGGVARWPYGADRVTLLVNTERFGIKGAVQ